MGRFAKSLARSAERVNGLRTVDRGGGRNSLRARVQDKLRPTRSVIKESDRFRRSDAAIPALPYAIYYAVLRPWTSYAVHPFNDTRERSDAPLSFCRHVRCLHPNSVRIDLSRRSGLSLVPAGKRLGLSGPLPFLDLQSNVWQPHPVPFHIAGSTHASPLRPNGEAIGGCPAEPEGSCDEVCKWPLATPAACGLLGPMSDVKRACRFAPTCLQMTQSGPRLLGGGAITLCVEKPRRTFASRQPGYRRLSGYRSRHHISACRLSRRSRWRSI